LVLLLIAIFSFGILLLLVRLPEGNVKKWLDRPLHTSCIEYKGNVDCDSIPYLFVFFFISVFILFGPSLIVLKIFSIEFIPEKWMVVSIIFSFFVYFLIDFLVSFLLKKRKAKHSNKTESNKQG
jgi:antibiotic biosynthesis monooxygenase (ABM) superfamily enzyme